MNARPAWLLWLSPIVGVSLIVTGIVQSDATWVSLGAGFLGVPALLSPKIGATDVVLESDEGATSPEVDQPEAVDEEPSDGPVEVPHPTVDKAFWDGDEPPTVVKDEDHTLDDDGTEDVDISDYEIWSDDEEA